MVMDMGWVQGRWIGRRWWYYPPVALPLASRGYIYIGPCRCGFGPNAFYLTPTGQIVHAWQLTGLAFPGFLPWTMTPISERNMLETEKKMLEEELRYIEERLKQIGGE